MFTKPLIAYMIAYFALLFLYFYTETRDNFNHRAANKTALALLFFAFAAITFWRYYPLKSIRLLLLLGLGFACAGDITLLWSFTRGGVLFGIGNIIMVIYELIVAFRLDVSPLAILPALLVFAAFWGTVMMLYHRDRIDFNDIGVYPVYLGSVTVHGSIGIVLAAARRTPAVVFVGLGLFLMMVADYFLTVYEFKHRRNWILRCNSGAYFTGVFMVALSMIFPL